MELSWAMTGLLGLKRKIKAAELRCHLAGIGCGRAETFVNIITLKTKLT